MGSGAGRVLGMNSGSEVRDNILSEVLEHCGSAHNLEVAVLHV